VGNPRARKNVPGEANVRHAASHPEKKGATDNAASTDHRAGVRRYRSTRNLEPLEEKQE